MNKQTHKTKHMKTKQETSKARNHLLAGRVDLDTLERVKAAAEKQGVTISTVVSRALQTVDDWNTEVDYLKQLKKENPQGALDHYKQGSKEVIEMMVDIWGREAVAKHCEMCAFKYRMRLGNKPDQPIERDLEKARWYENKAKELR